jgi:transcriptional regulator with XRE-family HTH domain
MFKAKTPHGQLQRLRIQQNLSQAKVAVALGVAERSLNLWENGRRYPTLTLLQWFQLAEIYDVSLSSLLQATLSDFPEKV